jgi:RNA polymerase sigma factor (sigma-70 family)
MTADQGDVTLLVKRAATGDQSAWDALVARYTNLLWSVARAYRLERTDAADVVQVAWLRLVEHLPTLREPERVGSWLATTVRRECLQLLAARKRRGAPIDDTVLDNVPDDAVPLDHGLLTTERNAALWSAFARLPERCQKLLRVLMVDPPPSYQDVSASLEMPVGSIGPTRARCLDRLRALISQAGPAEAVS